MMHWGKPAACSLVGIYLLLTITPSVYSQAPEERFGMLSGPLRVESQLEGQVMCVKCTLQEVQDAYPKQTDFYLLGNDKAQVVFEVTKVSDLQRWQPVVLSRQLWVQGPEHLVHALVAEENLFKKMTLIGRLGTDRTFDLATVSFPK